MWKVFFFLIADVYPQTLWETPTNIVEDKLRMVNFVQKVACKC